MSTRVKRKATYADLAALPVWQVDEIVEGDLYASPRPASRHAVASSVLGSELLGPFQLGRGGPGGWWILDEPELHLDRDVVVPDIAGWRRERLAVVEDVPHFTLAPDWICEVLSPSTARFDRVKKLGVYARAGVVNAWIVDAIGRTLEVLRRDGAQWMLVATHGGDDRVRAEPFDAVEIGLGALWLPDPPA